jgi:hypothetical protein
MAAPTITLITTKPGSARENPVVITSSAGSITVTTRRGESTLPGGGPARLPQRGSRD